MNASKKLRELNRAKIEHDKVQLSAQIENSKGVLNNIAESVLAQTIERQAAQIEMMRVALQSAEWNSLDLPQFVVTQIVEALSSTSDQALEQFAAKVKEQCAQVCESMSGSDYSPKQCASAIRAIKDLPK